MLETKPVIPEFLGIQCRDMGPNAKKKTKPLEPSIWNRRLQFLTCCPFIFWLLTNIDF